MCARVFSLLFFVKLCVLGGVGWRHEEQSSLRKIKYTLWLHIVASFNVGGVPRGHGEILFVWARAAEFNIEGCQQVLPECVLNFAEACLRICLIALLFVDLLFSVFASFVPFVT